MTLLWIADILLLVVVIPIVVLLLHKLRQPVIEIRKYTEDTLEHGVLAIAQLDAVDELVETRDRIAMLRDQVAGYGGTVAKILGA